MYKEFNSYLNGVAMDEASAMDLHSECETYPASGGKGSFHGVAYQLKLLMLFAWRGTQKKYEFRLATEMDEADKFDDVVFQYKKSGTGNVSYRFLQAKHTQTDNERTVKITGRELFTEKDEKYSLHKYFKSYLKIKNNPKFNSDWQDFVICTNIDLDFDPDFAQQGLKKICDKTLYFESVSQCDDILNNDGNRYRFVSEATDAAKRQLVLSELQTLFQHTSEFYKLARALVHNLLKGDTTDKAEKAIFKTYREPLARYVIDVESQKLSEQFLNGAINQSVNDFRNEIHVAVKQYLKQLEQLKRKKPKEFTKRDDDILKCDLNSKNPQDFWHEMSKFTFKLSDNQRQLQTTSLPSKISNEEVEDFLDKFVFAVNQPNEEKLSQLIKTEIREEFNLIDAELVTNYFQDKMLAWMKEKQGENRYLSQKDIAAFFEEAKVKVAQSVLIGHTSEYTQNIKKSRITFKSECLPYDIRTFLNQPSGSGCILNFVSPPGEIFFGNVKVRQLLEKIEKYKIDGSYISIRLSSLSESHELIQVFEKEGMDLLIVDCKSQTNPIDNKDDLIEILISLKIKILLISSIRNKFVEKLEEKAQVKEIKDKTSFSDLTKGGQKPFLESKVTFQGVEISLNHLMPAESHLAHLALPLDDLLNGKLIEIGKPVPISSGYNRIFYLDRTFNKVTIAKQKMNDFELKNITDLIAKSEKEFETSCKENPDKNVHWLEEESGQLLWQKSQGSLKNLREYVDSNHMKHYSQEDIQQAHQGRIMIIADSAGMGKSTVLTHLSQEIKKQNPYHWVIRIDLNDHADSLQTRMIQEGELFNTEEALNFVVDNLLMIQQDLEKSIFKCLLQEKRMLIMFDGFDEISPYYKNIVINLLKALKANAEQLWVTTRPHLKETLEDALGHFCYALEPFNESNQIDFLVKFWKQNLGEDTNECRMRTYAKKLVEKLAKSISDQEKQFTGIPLQTRMVAEIFERKQDTANIPKEIKQEIETIEEGAKEFSSSQEEIPIFPNQINLVNLYNVFVYKKYYDVYVKEKAKSTSVTVDIALTKQYPQFIYEHQQLSVCALLECEKCSELLPGTETQTLIEDIQADAERRGFVDQIISGKPHFIHRTFAEYFLADFLLNQNIQTKAVRLFLLNVVFLKDEYRVVRSFLNGKLATTNLSKGTLQQYGKVIVKLLKKQLINGKYFGKRTNGTSFLHRASHEGNIEIIKFLFKSLQAKQYHMRLMWLSKNEERRTAFQVAVYRGWLEVLQELRRVAKDMKIKAEVLRKSVLSKDWFKLNVFYWSARNGNLAVVRELWGYVKGMDVTSEKLIKLLLVQDNEGQTLFHCLADIDNLEIFKEMWDWTKYMSIPSKEFKQLLLIKVVGHKVGDNTFHLAAMVGQLEALEELCDHAKSMNLSTDGLTQLMLAKDDQERIAFHLTDIESQVVMLKGLATENKERTAFEWVELWRHIEKFRELGNQKQMLYNIDWRHCI